MSKQRVSVGGEGSPSVGVAPSVRAVGVGHYYSSRAGGKMAALRDINVTIAPGSFACLVGPSGCGKSTLLGCIAGLMRCTEGALYVGDRQITGPSAEASMVFQQPALFPWKTVADNVAVGFGASRLSRMRAREKAQMHLDAVGLGSFAGRYPHELSGGMAQRVGIARALAAEPTLLLMDEPFAAVDAQTRRQLQSQLLRLVESRAITIIFVTHDVGEAVYLGDRVIVMSARPGQIIEKIDLEAESADRFSTYFSSTTAHIIRLLEPKEEQEG